MLERISLQSAHDGFKFDCLHALPSGPTRGGVIILQEIFGLDPFIEADVERWASVGFEVVAPSLFDRAERGFVANHDAVGVAKGFELLKKISREQAMGDIAACLSKLQPVGPAFVVGYCYGGKLAWEAAALVEGIAAASCYYGQIAPLVELTPKCPTICHFGGHDAHIDATANRDAILAAHPHVRVYIYEASGHGFNNEGAPGADPNDALLARRRTLELFTP